MEPRLNDPHQTEHAPSGEKMADLHRHETASLGLRARRLSGEGTEHGRLVRLMLLSRTRWPGNAPQDPWPANATIAKDCGLTETQVEWAVACLRSAEVITTRWGKRPKTTPGRLIHVNLHAPCKALAPSGFDVRNLWQICRSNRARPAALVTMMVGAYMLACDAAGREIEDWAALGCTASALRRFVGHADNASWTKRVRELEDLGLIRREGRKIFVSPPRAWFALTVEQAEVQAEGIIAGRIGSREEPQAWPKLAHGRLLRVGDGERAAPVELARTGTDPRGPPDWRNR